VLAGRAEAGRIARATAERVRAAARRLGYRPNLLARSLRTRRTRTLGLLVTDLANPFFATIAAAVEAAASAAGYTLIIAASGEEAGRELKYLRELQTRPTDGLMVTPTPGGEVRAELKKLAASGFPLVTIDRRVAGLECDRVICDGRRAAGELVSWLAGLGCRRLALAGGPAGVWTAEERLAGFRAGLARAGLAFARRLFRAGEFTAEHGRAAAADFLRERHPPDGIVAANNRILAGVLEVLTEAGQDARRIAVAGFDGVPYAAFLGRPIAVAEQPAETIGRSAARLLIERIEGQAGSPREVLLPVAIRSFGPGPKAGVQAEGAGSAESPGKIRRGA
jgi:LacI family transcriptional regulator